MKVFLSNPNSWLSIITAITAIAAIFISVKQIRLNNKQHLFDKRLEKYTVIRDLLSLYSKNKTHIIDNDSITTSLNLEFSWLTNVSYLCDMIYVINQPLDTEKQNTFITKCEMLEKYSVEISILWNNKAGKTFAKFVLTYKELLQKMYQQRVCVNTYEDYNENQNGVIELMYTYDQVKEEAKKNANDIGLFETINKLDELYNIIVDNNYEQKILKSLKIKD